MDALSVEGGFANPVYEAQSVFRAVMDAMARPGTVQEIRCSVSPPPPLTPTGAAVALTLCDHDTPLWLDPALQGAAGAGTWLSFHTGSPVAATPAEAHFALAAEPGALIALDNFAQGTQEYPDRSTTLILQVGSLQAGAELLLEGPGIQATASIAPTPLPRHFAEQWRQNRARFPRGIDVILAAPGAVACLPRTTVIRTMEA